MASAVAGAAAISQVPSGGCGPSPMSQRLKRFSISIMASSEDGWLGHEAARGQEVEVAALVGLGDMALVEGREGALVTQSCRFPFGAAALQFLLVDPHVEAPCLYVKLHEVAGLEQAERPAYGGLGRDMEDASAVVRATHASVADAHHVAHALLQKLLRNRQIAPFGHAGCAHRAG